MHDLISIKYSDLADALYYFEFMGPLYKRIKWLERDKNVFQLYKLIREIKFPRFKNFLPYARFITISNDISSPTQLAKHIRDHPPKGKFAEKWVAEYEKMRDILREIYNYFMKNVLTNEKKEELEKLRKKIEKKYGKIWHKLKVESEKLPGISWKRKSPIVCLLYPLDGKLSHKLKFSDIAFIETSQAMVDDEALFLHEVVKLLNYTKPVGSWVRQDRRGIRAIAYEIFTELQTLKIVNALFDKKPNYKTVINLKLDSIWIPFIRPETSLDEDELERVLAKAYKKISKHEYDAMFQMSELYTELNIILLT